MPLTTKKRSELRAQAHMLDPVVIIGDKGLTDLVIAEIDRSLKAHELIKVRAAAGDRDARSTWFAKICEALGAEEVQEIGKILVLYRENPEKPDSRSEPQRGAGNDKKRRSAEGGKVKGTERPRSRTPSPRPASEPLRRRPRTSR